MLAILDPNVVISGLLSPAGSPARVLRAWRDGRFELIVSPLLLDELRRALAYHKLRQRIQPDEIGAVVEWLARGATLVDDPPDEPPIHSQDPGDDYLIALAARHGAALVSGDKHVLALAGRIPAYSPREFLELL